MDGVQELLGVTVIAATNRPDVIVSSPSFVKLPCYFMLSVLQDSALMRPGRLDRILYVGPPDQVGREEILRIQTKKMSVEPNLDLSTIATLVRTIFYYTLVSVVDVVFLQAEGCSGAEMTALCQEAALLTMKQDLDAPFVCFFWPRF